jgi:hypothetical protein
LYGEGGRDVSRLRLCTDTPLKCTMTQEALCSVDRAINCYTASGKGIDLDAVAPISIGDLVALLCRRQVEGFSSAIIVSRPTFSVESGLYPSPYKSATQWAVVAKVGERSPSVLTCTACLCGGRCSQELSMAVILKENKSAGDENQKMNAKTSPWHSSTPKRNGLPPLAPRSPAQDLASLFPT